MFTDKNIYKFQSIALLLLLLKLSIINLLELFQTDSWNPYKWSC